SDCSGIRGYSYSLTADPDDVIDTTATSVTVPNVAPGMYVFKIKSQDNNGLWSDVASYTVIITTVSSTNRVTVRITNPLSGSTLQGTVPLQWIATDLLNKSLTTRIDYRQSNGTWIPLEDWTPHDGTFNWNTTTIQDGADYLVRVTARDPDGVMGSDQISALTINNHPAQSLHVEIQAQPQEGEAPLLVDFDALVSGGNRPYTYNWNLGDGSIETGKTFEHLYSQPGIYHVTLVVYDALHASGTGTVTIAVTKDEITNTKQKLFVSQLGIINDCVAPGDELQILASVTNNGNTNMKEVRLVPGVPEFGAWSRYGPDRLKKGRTMQKYMTLYVPATAQPGDYYLHLELAGDKDSGEMITRVTLWPFTVARTCRD
ncbi:PKD domain-containing protein, partial [Candidatus Woesearchaeota archaeon]|nr:PKD domain-containing protein [Candidatus Woesearchaeota archaeon]